MHYLSPTFYETSTGCIVSIDEGATELKIEHSPNVPTDIPHIDKNAVALHDYDVHVLDSVKSGVRSSKGVYASVLKPLLDNFQIRHTYHETKSKDSVKAFATALAAVQKATLVVVISGDTSINELVNALPRVENGNLKLFVVPAGTGNSLALSLSITSQARAVLRLFTHKKEDSRPLNTYEARFPERSYIFDRNGNHEPILSPLLFLVVASWAFHASLVADSDTEELRKYGMERFKMAAKQNLSRPQKYTGTATVLKRGKKIEEIAGPFAYFVLTPSQRFEPKFVILPKGDIFDSNLYLVLFAYQDNDAYIIDIMGQVYNDGSHVKNSSVRYDLLDSESTLKLHFDADNGAQNRRFCVDGAIVVIPEEVNEGDATFNYFGNSYNGWDIEIIS